MDLNEYLTRRFLESVLVVPEGRAHVLNLAADAESSDEGAVFDKLLGQVDDAELRKLVRRHQADELRHGELFRECLARTGVAPGPVPAELKLLDRIDRALGGMMAEPIEDRAGVMRAYLVLQVIEERAITQFALFERAFRAVDPATAEVFVAVARDEERHLRYCHAIARRYAPDAATHEATLRRYRAIEARAFAENGRANVAYIHAQPWGRPGLGARMLWSGVEALARVLPLERRTRFWDAAPGVDPGALGEARAA